MQVGLLVQQLLYFKESYMSKSPFFKSLIKNLPSETSVASDGTSSSEFTGYVDTGNYAFNAALSGSLFGGMPKNKITALCGDPASGKTILALGIARKWLDDNPEGAIIYFDTESATTNSMLESHGIDLDRFVKSEPETIEKFRQTALQILDRYAETPEKERQPMMMILDSLGNLSSEKEVQDIRDQKDTRDMTKAGLLRGTFRVLRLKLAKLNVAMIVNNHVYQNVGNPYGPPKVISGGCVAAGTLVIMGDDTLKPIESIISGDVVKTYDGLETVTHVWNPNTLEEGTPECIEIEWEDGTKTIVSEKHSFVVGDRWVMAKELTLNDEVKTIRDINNSSAKPQLETYLESRISNNLSKQERTK